MTSPIPSRAGTEGLGLVSDKPSVRSEAETRYGTHQLTSDDLYEAEYKLQNCIRITCDVESFKAEVFTGVRYVPIADYVLALIQYVKDGSTK